MFRALPMALELRTSAWRRLAVTGLQVGALAGALWFLVDTARDNWSAIGTADFTPAWAPLVLASVLTAATYLYQVRIWVHTMGWWDQRLPYLPALRIWFVANLARFIPGIVWQFAGVAAMVREYRVSAVAATAAILLQQIVLFATGVGLTAALAPALLGPWAGTLPSGLAAALAALGLGLVILLLPRALPLAGRLLERITGSPGRWPLPRPVAFAAYVVSLGVSWVVYGVSFWLFAAAMLPQGAPDLLVASSAFVASYVAGLLAVFAPAGLVVREAAMVVVLSPIVGGGQALALAIGSRLWLIAVEITTAVLVVAVYHLAPKPAPPPQPGDRS